jgi:hypothetical protein
MFKLIGTESQGISLLDIHVEMIVGIPWGPLIFLDPGALEACRPWAERICGSSEFIQ